MRGEDLLDNTKAETETLDSSSCSQTPDMSQQGGNSSTPLFFFLIFSSSSSLSSTHTSWLVVSGPWLTGCPPLFYLEQLEVTDSHGQSSGTPLTLCDGDYRAYSSYVAVVLFKAILSIFLLKGTYSSYFTQNALHYAICSVYVVMLWLWWLFLLHLEKNDDPLITSILYTVHWRKVAFLNRVTLMWFRRRIWALHENTKVWDSESSMIAGVQKRWYGFHFHCNSSTLALYEIRLMLLCSNT